MTYRLADHTTADDASRYRDDAEVSTRWADEPIVRLRNYLSGAGLWSKADEEALLHEASQMVEQAAAAYLATPPQDAVAMFAHIYASPPADLVAQREMVVGRDPPGAS